MEVLLVGDSGFMGGVCREGKCPKVSIIPSDTLLMFSSEVLLNTDLLNGSTLAR